MSSLRVIKDVVADNVETTSFTQASPAMTGDAKMNALYGAFQAVDAGFNAVSSSPGLTIPQIIALGYFQENSTVLAHGPFTPCPVGQHSNHTNQPGCFQAIGQGECAYTQNFFEGGILSDPNFPWDATLQQDKHPRLYHTPPIVTSISGTNRVHVLATAIVTYAPNGVPPFGTSPPWVPGNGNIVAVVKSSADYVIEPAPLTDPSRPSLPLWIDNIDFTIAYNDGPMTRLLGNNPFATTNGSGTVVVTVPGSLINGPPMGNPVAIGNVINISGVTGPVNGIPAVNINGNVSVTAVTATTFSFVAGALATATGSAGGLGGPDGIIARKL